MTVQPRNNNLYYLIDPTFTNVNRLFVLPFQGIAGKNNTTKDLRERSHVKKITLLCSKCQNKRL